MVPALLVYVVDDDPAVLKAVGRLLQLNGFRVETFASSAVFLERPRAEGPACLILDLQMPGVNGLDLQESLANKGVVLPIIFLSGQGDVPSTVRAMRSGAVDFLVKPVDEPELLAALARAEALVTSQLLRRQLAEDTESRLARLTAREREVCELVARGLLNKQIAAELGTVEKTVKVHRGRVMRKLEVNSVAALVRLLERRVDDEVRAER
jgi:FixJ family two-component response regulator